MDNLGRLVKSLGGKCLECLQPQMQLRVRTLDNGSEREYEYCSHCGFEKSIGYKEKGRVRGHKKRLSTEISNGKTSR